MKCLQWWRREERQIKSIGERSDFVLENAYLRRTGRAPKMEMNAGIPEDYCSQQYRAFLMLGGTVTLLRRVQSDPRVSLCRA